MQEAKSYRPREARSQNSRNENESAETTWPNMTRRSDLVEVIQDLSRAESTQQPSAADWLAEHDQKAKTSAPASAERIGDGDGDREEPDPDGA